MPPRVNSNSYFLPGVARNDIPDENRGLRSVLKRVGRKGKQDDIINFGFVKSKKGGIVFKSGKLKNDLRYIKDEVIYDSIIVPLHDDLTYLSACGCYHTESLPRKNIRLENMWTTMTPSGELVPGDELRGFPEQKNVKKKEVSWKNEEGHQKRAVIMVDKKKTRKKTRKKANGHQYVKLS